MRLYHKVRVELEGRAGGTILKCECKSEMRAFVMKWNEAREGCQNLCQPMVPPDCLLPFLLASLNSAIV